MTAEPVTKKVLCRLPYFGDVKGDCVCLLEQSERELLDLLAREEKIMKNKKFLEKLPDRGARIKKFNDSIKDELKRRNAHKQLCKELEKLSIYNTKDTLERLEWTGEYKTSDASQTESDGQTTLLKLLATHSSTDISKKKIVNRCSPVEGSIQKTPSVIESKSASFPNIDVYARQLCTRMNIDHESTIKMKFHTHVPLKTSYAKVMKSDVTETAQETKACTTSKIMNNGIKVLSLHESLVVQQEQAKALKGIDLHTSTERLRAETKQCNSDFITSNLGTYEGFKNNDDCDGSINISNTACGEYEDADDI